MDLGKTIQASINLYFKNFSVLWVAGFVASLITAATFGILAGPLLGGFMFVVLKIFRGERGEINDIFAHFDQFGATFIISLIFFGGMTILGMIPFLNILAFIANPLLIFIWAISLILVIDKNLKPMDAIQQALEWTRANPLMLWVYTLIMTLLASIGAIICGIGVIVTLPLNLVGMAVVYSVINDSPVISEGPRINVE